MKGGKMKNKILITIIAGIFLIGMVSAWEVGDTFTQSQIDKVNMSSLTKSDLSCQAEGWHIESRVLHVDYSCLVLDKIDGLYEVVKPVRSYKVGSLKVFACVFLHDVPFCKEKYRQSARDEVSFFLDLVKKRMEGYQTIDEYDIGEWFDDWDVGE